MIGCNLLTASNWGHYVTAYQLENKIYATYGYKFSDGFEFNNYTSYANVIYI